MIADRGEEFEGCKRAVGDQDNIAVGEPAMDLQCGLARPMPIDAIAASMTA